MRFHSRYPLLQLWCGEGWKIVGAPALRVARLEPAVTNLVGGAALVDLVFAQDERIAVIPFVRIDPTSMVRHERTPMIWPRAVRPLGFDTLRAIEDQVLPWLQTLVLARQQNDEAVKFFSAENFEGTYDAARAAGFLGAARYDELMPALAPYLYAARFCAEGSVGIVDATGANGAAMLATRAQLVRADLRTSERNALAARWFGLPIFGDVTVTHDVAIAHAEAPLQARKVRIVLDAEDADARTVPVASSVPMDVLVSFDPEDAPVARTFSVHSNLHRAVRGLTCAPTPGAAGGSAGFILLLMREDFERAPNADVEEAGQLASRLRAEGFSVELRAPSAVPEAYKPDLVHAFAVSGHSTEQTLRRLHESGVPVVANPNLGSVPQEADWGPDVLATLYVRPLDDAVVSEKLDLLCSRRLNTDRFSPTALPVHALPHVDVTIVASEAEGRHLREALGFGGTVVPYAPLFSGTARPVANISSLVGTEPFVLAHGPVDWRMNLPMLASAAAHNGVRLVIAGPLVDFGCLRYATQLAPELVIHIPSPDEGDLDALYRCAHVYADVSWGPQGLHRLARAAASGCRLLVSQPSWAHTVWTEAVSADPASVASVTSALAQAWAGPQATPVGGADLFSASIFAYSKAVAARQPA